MKKTPGTQKRENEMQTKKLCNKKKKGCQRKSIDFFNSLSFPKGIGKKLWNQQTEPKRSFGIPEGVHRYVERRGLLIARKEIIL